MPTLWLFDIEPHEQRYTGEWQTYLPVQLEAAMAKRPQANWRLEIISGGEGSGQLTTGAFLDFADTNRYKSQQIVSFSQKVQDGTIKKNDRLLFTDAWHPGVIQCRYMSDLLDLNLKIHVMWHAGGYDRNDLLGRKSSNKRWTDNFERAVFHAADKSYFATKYHRALFQKVLKSGYDSKARVVGWPMEYLPKLLSKYSGVEKQNIILFPHRISDEKQPDIFTFLSFVLPEYRFVFAQDQKRTKAEYHALLARALVVFSASKQETLGIGIYEGMLCGAAPIVPTRLSYKEICRAWCYSGHWTRNLDAAKENSEGLASYIRSVIDVRDPKKIQTLAQQVGSKYFHGGMLYASVLR